jgi:serine/threonine protein kinase
MGDGQLPFDTDAMTDDVSVETPDLTPPPAPAPASARPLRRAPAPADAAADLDGRYTRGESIGGGPLGAVHRGRHVALGTEVCIKELKDIFGYFSFLQRGEVLKRLKRELCAQAQVHHPAVVTIVDQAIDGARPYVVMELLSSSLRERLESAGGKSLPVPGAIRTFLQLSYALRAAHAAGLTHHNLKPENVLFDACGNAKLGDFGLSRLIEVEPGRGLPQVFVGTGSLSYLAPELITRKDAGPAADVYGLGILLYEMLTGGIPGRRSPLPSEVNPEVPSKLDTIFDKMTQDRREARYPDFDAMLDEFYGAFSDGEYLQRGDLILSSEPSGA